MVSALMVNSADVRAVTTLARLVKGSALLSKQIPYVKPLWFGVENDLGVTVPTEGFTDISRVACECE